MVAWQETEASVISLAFPRKTFPHLILKISENPYSLCFTFSNSLTIHQLKQRKSWCDGAWIGDLNNHILYQFNSPFFVSIKKIYQRQKTVFEQIPNTSNFFKSIPLRILFSTLFCVFGNNGQTRSLTFDIFLHKRAWRLNWFCTYIVPLGPVTGTVITSAGLSVWLNLFIWTCDVLVAEATVTLLWAERKQK